MSSTILSVFDCQPARCKTRHAFLRKEMPYYKMTDYTAVKRQTFVQGLRFSPVVVYEPLCTTGKQNRLWFLSKGNSVTCKHCLKAIARLKAKNE